MSIPSGGRPEILLVDDDARILDAWRVILTDAGCAVTTAGTGEDALVAARRKTFAAALLDLQLPDTSGLEVFAALRERDPEVQGILVTGHASVGSVVEAMGQGLYSYLVKPVSSAMVVAMVARALERRRLQAENRQMVAHLRALQEITDVALSGLDLDALLRELLQRLRAVLHSDAATVLLLTEDRQHLTVRASEGLTEGIAAGVRIPVGHGIAGRIAATGEPVAVDDVSRAGPFSPWLRERVHSLMGVPLVVDGCTTGVVHVASFRPRRYTSDELCLLQLAAERIALAVARARLYEVEREARARAEAAACALARSEGRYRSLVETCPDAIALLDLDLRIAMANQQAAWLGGLTRPNELVGKHLAEFLGPGEREELAERTREVLAAGLVRNVEATLLRTDGTPCPVEYSASLVRDEHGDPSGFIVVTRDISERRRVEEERLAYHQQLRSLASQLALTEERERRRIATGLHDEIGQMLAICKIRLDAARALVEPDDARGCLAELDCLRGYLEQSIRATRSLIFDLSPPILYELGLEAALEDLTERLREEHGIACRFRADGRRKPLADEIRVSLFQAVREALLNIVKHAGATQAAVDVCRDGPQVRITVEDDGAGFDVPAVPRRSGGSGFGLFGMRERLRHLGGSVAVESAPGQGTRITITAPLEAGTPPATPSPSNPGGVGISPGSGGRGGRECDA